MKNLFWGIIFILIGTLLLLDNLDYVDGSKIIHDYWPLILILWGISILTRNKSKNEKLSEENFQQYTEELIHQSNVFGDIILNISSQSFKGGSINSVFGNCTIDLSNSSIATGEHEFKIHGVFGDSYIKVPKDFPVMITANSFLGDLSIFGERKSGLSQSYHFTSTNYELTNCKMKLTITKIFGNIIIE